ncbi:TPA: hypothetical protein MAG25_005491 [Klebsiella quasipneumoniae subsp. quasipneumoniae]|nr:hypothetical protein [Klebsiella quasipneumoniae subsp. similipneumoniae]HBS3705481.1 hypothetical protein [Klebsiella quasipneumoniae subsp. quasipneumoniae]HBW7359255.1 hypothetical protein [Klebsiella pneumoniae]
MDLVDSSEGWAVIRLASLAKQSSREPARLLFATITELTPERMLPPPMSGFETVTVKSTKERIFFRRTLLALSDARQWYLSLQEGVCKTPLPTLEAERNLALDGLPLFTAGKLYDEKPWPQMSLPIGEGFFALPLAENDPAPFIGSTTSRIHRRFDGGGIEHFAGFLLDDEATTFVAQRMHINLRGYQEYLGSACYVSPQRILRRVENFIVDAGKEGDESLLFRFVAMPGQTVEGLELTTFDTDMNLLTDFQTHKLRSDGVVIQKKAVCDGEYGYVLRHPSHGILAFSPPSPFIRHINVGVGVADRTQYIVDVPIDESPDAERLTYHASRSMVQSTSTAVVREAEPAQIRAKRREQHYRRQRKIQADTQGQRWFKDNHRKEAMRFFHALIQTAKKRIIIADPYFGGLQFSQYLYKVSSRQVNVDILTTVRAFTGNSAEEKARTFLDGIEEIRKNHHITIKTHILPGNLLHDRFIVIDDEVWFSGNSLNSFGKQASVIVKLPDPQTIIDNLELILAQGRQLETHFSLSKRSYTSGENE